MKSIKSSLFYTPLSNFSWEELQVVKKELTICHAFEKEKSVETYDCSRVGYLGLPLEYAKSKGYCVSPYLERLEEGRAIDCPKRPDPHHEKVKNPKQQAEFMRRMVSCSRDTGLNLFEADTGTGKTPVALNAIAELGRSALVIVPRVSIAYQWVREIKLHLGLEKKR